MAVDRQGIGLTFVRISIGVFFIFQGLGRIRWILDASILGRQLAEWEHLAAPGSTSLLYLQRVMMPGAAILARVVPIGEMACGVALLLGIWTPLVAFVAFLMALNFQIASSAILHYSFLTSGNGLPVLGSTLGLALGGVRLPWSIRS